MQSGAVAPNCFINLHVPNPQHLIFKMLAFRQFSSNFLKLPSIDHELVQVYYTQVAKQFTEPFWRYSGMYWGQGVPKWLKVIISCVIVFESSIFSGILLRTIKHNFDNLIWISWPIRITMTGSAGALLGTLLIFIQNMSCDTSNFMISNDWVRNDTLKSVSTNMATPEHLEQVPRGCHRGHFWFESKTCRTTYQSSWFWENGAEKNWQKYIFTDVAAPEHLEQVLRRPLKQRKQTKKSILAIWQNKPLPQHLTRVQSGISPEWFRILRGHLSVINYHQFMIDWGWLQKNRIKIAEIPAFWKWIAGGRVRED